MAFLIGPFNDMWKITFFGCLVFLSGAVGARTLVDVEYKTDRGCKIVKYESIESKR